MKVRPIVNDSYEAFRVPPTVERVSVSFSGGVSLTAMPGDWLIFVNNKLWDVKTNTMFADLYEKTS